MLLVVAVVVVTVVVVVVVVDIVPAVESSNATNDVDVDGNGAVAVVVVVAVALACDWVGNAVRIMLLFITYEVARKLDVNLQSVVRVVLVVSEGVVDGLILKNAFRAECKTRGVTTKHSTR